MGLGIIATGDVTPNCLQYFISSSHVTCTHAAWFKSSNRRNFKDNSLKTYLTFVYLEDKAFLEELLCKVFLFS